MQKWDTCFRYKYGLGVEGNIVLVEEVTATVYAPDEKAARCILASWMPQGTGYYAQRAQFDQPQPVNDAQPTGVFFRHPRKELYRGPFNEVPKDLLKD